MPTKMVKFELKETHPMLTYRVLLTNILAAPLDPQKGATLAEQRQMRGIRKRLEAANDVLYLTPEEREDLLQRCDRTPWQMNVDIIVEFADDLAAATEVELTEAPAPESSPRPPEPLPAS